MEKGKRDKYGNSTNNLKKSYVEKSIENREAVLKSYLKVNHAGYLAKPLRIGFMESFPEDPKNVIDEMIISDTCGRFRVEFKVRYGKVTLGEDGKYSCYGITTDRVSISEQLPLSGFNSYSHIPESAVMEKAIITMAEKHGLMICDKVCSWPYAKAIVQDVEDAHLRCFQEKQEKIN